MASILISGGRSLHPVTNKRGESFDKVVDQNFSLIFHWANYTLTKLPLFFTFPYFSIYTLNKTFSLEEKEPQNREKNLSQKLGGTSAQN